MAQLKAGIIGCGGIANGKHMPAIKKIKDVAMTAFCDIRLERAQEAAEKYAPEGTKPVITKDYLDLVNDKTLDVIYVLTPNRDHSYMTVAALEAGKHVMCEKPMASNSAEAKKMVDAAKKSGKLLTIGYQNRYRDNSLYLKKCVQRGDLGDIYFAKAHALRRRGVPTWGVFLDEEAQGGGPLIDIGTHALDMTLWLMDNYKPKTVMGSVYHKLNADGDCGNCFGPWDPEKFTVEDAAFGFITMENGATIVLESSWALNILDAQEGASTLCGTKAGADMREGLRFNGASLGKTYTAKPDLGAGGVAYFDGERTSPELYEQHLFYNAILKGDPLTVLPEQAYVVTQILEAIYESAKTGKPVHF